MEKFKKVCLQLLYPNIFLFVLFFLIGFGLLITVFVFSLETHWISYIAYFLFAYALTITVARSIHFIKWIH